MDRPHVDADLDPAPNFHFYADPDPDWHQNDADSHADRTPSFTHVNRINFLLLASALPVVLVSAFWTAYGNFRKKVKFIYIICLEFITDPDQPGRIRQRQNDIDPTRSGSTALLL